MDKLKSTEAGRPIPVRCIRLVRCLSTPFRLLKQKLCGAIFHHRPLHPTDRGMMLGSNENTMNIEQPATAAVRSSDGLCLSRPWTWKDKLRCKLFPPQYCDLPEAPPTHKDVLVCRVTSELSWLDRLRVLATGRLQVESRTVTENVIGDHK